MIMIQKLGLYSEISHRSMSGPVYISLYNPNKTSVRQDFVEKNEVNL